MTTGPAGGHLIPVATCLPGENALLTATVYPAMLVARMAQLFDKQQVD